MEKRDGVVEFTRISTGVTVPGKRMVVWIPAPVHRAARACAISLDTPLGHFVAEALEKRLEELGEPVLWPDPEEPADVP